MHVNAEISGRCAIAALSVLAREVDRVACAPAHAERLRRLVHMARGHVAGLLDETPGSKPASPSADHASDGLDDDDAAAAWGSAAALRRSFSDSAHSFHRDRLQTIATTTWSERVRHMCRDALRDVPLAW
ncbi:hypothetical protein ACO2RV_14575 [Ancylobacter sp. VNQ12]|uniref:hypothetical protein n=1 Tax=Ancylobacter sp. VNQ12 TaxID=3400920 RepID=UPI003BFC3924